MYFKTVKKLYYTARQPLNYQTRTVVVVVLLDFVLLNITWDLSHMVSYFLHI